MANSLPTAPRDPPSLGPEGGEASGWVWGGLVQLGHSARSMILTTRTTGGDLKKSADFCWVGLGSADGYSFPVPGMASVHCFFFSLPMSFIEVCWGLINSKLCGYGTEWAMEGLRWGGPQVLSD